jgi:uncharacterized protein YeaO (DUF488 family)
MEPEDGYRLLVMRHWPRGVRKAQVEEWMRELGPSASLLRAYREGQIDWPTFAARYRAQVRDTETGQTLLAEVEHLEELHGTVTLLCHENLSRPDTRCHRVILKELLDARASRSP